MLITLFRRHAHFLVTRIILEQIRSIIFSDSQAKARVTNEEIGIVDALVGIVSAKVLIHAVVEGGIFAE
jgi:hypothetical protein